MMTAEMTRNLFASLELMWKGMLGLFIVCGVLVLVLMLVSKICDR